MKARGRTMWTIAALAGLLAAAGESHAQTSAARSVAINGARLGPADIIALDYLNCGSPVPNGRYWVNWAARTWGYEGGPVQGRLPDCQRAAKHSGGSGNSGSGSRYVEDRVFERSGLSMIQSPVYR